MQDTYSLLRYIADSWVLLAMTGFFLGACLWAFRPGSRALHDDAARAIFRDGPEEGVAPPVTGSPDSPRAKTATTTESET